VLQRAAVAGLYQPIWSEWIVAETWRVLTHRWLVHRGPGDQKTLAVAANRMLRRLIPVMGLVSIRDFEGPSPWPGLKDREDEPIWTTAVLARATYVVSHNVEDFPPLLRSCHVYNDIEYLTVVEFMEGVLGEDASAVYGLPLTRAALVRSRRAR
jgi:hypothetical protein